MAGWGAEGEVSRWRGEEGGPGREDLYEVGGDGGGGAGLLRHCGEVVLRVHVEVLAAVWRCGEDVLHVLFYVEALNCLKRKVQLDELKEGALVKVSLVRAGFIVR